MKKLHLFLLAVAGFLALPAVSLADEIGDALTEGTGDLDLRYRLEYVDQEGFDDSALASTLRARLNYLTGDWRKASVFLEFDAVGTILIDDYNSGAGTSSGDRSRYPVVADPDYAEINQLYIDYDGWANTKLRAGRQRINLDNQRFVGGVGWRQNEQTYDAVSVRNKSLRNTAIFYSYLNNVNGIFGDDVPAGDSDSSSHLLNVGYDFENIGRLSGYFYDIDNKDQVGFSTSTFGVRFNGKANVADTPLKYLVEFATQSDAHDNAVNYDANYMRADIEADFEMVKAYLGYEVLEGDNTQTGAAFRTPLATLHAFNGWADQFLGTPDEGLEDFWIGAKGAVGPWKLNGKLHFFSAEASSMDFGNELDLSAARKLSDRYGLLLKAALFNGDNRSDVTKIWVMWTADF